jgi:hypothetical protein
MFTMGCVAENLLLYLSLVIIFGISLSAPSQTMPMVRAWMQALGGQVSSIHQHNAAHHENRTWKHLHFHASLCAQNIPNICEILWVQFMQTCAC